MTASPPSFLVVATGYNASAFLDAHVASLARQSWTAWRAVFVDDGSTDDTVARLKALLAQHGLTERFEIVENQQRRHKAYNVYRALKNHGRTDEVVAFVDADDALAVDEALERVAREYEQGWEVVWSNWRGSDGSRGTSGHLNPFISPRRQFFVSSHLFSFRQRLIDGVEERDLQDDEGRWFDAGSDVALAWPILEKTIKRKHIEDVLYIYNRGNPLSHDKLQPGDRRFVSPLQARTSEILRRRPGKEPAIDQQFLLDHLYAPTQAAMLSTRVAGRYEVNAAIEALKKAARGPGTTS